MEGKRFSTLIEEFCKKKEFNQTEAANFQLYVIEVFTEIRGHINSREYDFVSVRKLGTFFLKVWTVHNRMKELEKRLLGYSAPRMSTNHYRDEKKRYDELKELYERMTKDFFERKLYFAERKRERKEQGEERRLNQQYMADLAMDEIEQIQQYNIDNETTGYIETGLGEQE
jgi:hypothetical protein